MNMRRKILIGSFLAEALLLSTPFITPLQAQSTPSMNSSIDKSSPTFFQAYSLQQKLMKYKE
jgi:hypothetical protein